MKKLVIRMVAHIVLFIGFLVVVDIVNLLFY